VPRRNNRDRQYEPKDYKQNDNGEYFDYPSEKKKPVRRRKGKWDKDIYKDTNE
jgi:hypothetical protein